MQKINKHSNTSLSNFTTHCVILQTNMSAIKEAAQDIVQEVFTWFYEKRTPFEQFTSC